MRVPLLADLETTGAAIDAVGFTSEATSTSAAFASTDDFDGLATRTTVFDFGGKAPASTTAFGM